MDMKKFYGRAKVESAKLPTDGVFMTSVAHEDYEDHVAGRVMAVPTELNTQDISIAGLNLARGTHRLSTEAEIANWNEDQGKRRADILAAESGKHANLILPELLAGLAEARK